MTLKNTCYLGNTPACADDVLVCVCARPDSGIKFHFKEPYCIESGQSDMNRFEEGGDEQKQWEISIALAPQR